MSSSKGLQSITWDKQPVPMVKSPDRSRPEERIVDDAASQLTEYFSGKRKSFNIPLDTKGTIFQKKVWQALMEIPYGQTASYGDIARRIKNPKAVRAVGSANGRNPVCVIVPCHRVIASDGGIGGYSGGIGIKERLLKIEQR